MDTSVLKQIGKAISREKAKWNQKLVVFTFFLVIATVLWYLNKLSYEYSTELSYPVRFENFPKGKVLVGDPPRTINLVVKAYGYTLLRYKLIAPLSPLVVDIQQVSMSKLGDSDTKVFMLTSRIRGGLANQLRGEVQLEGIKPDTLFFEFTTRIEKKVRLNPNLHITYDKQHMLSGPIVLSPDSITISGPQSLIDTINSINIPLERFEKLNFTSERLVSIPTIHQVSFSHRRVTIIVPVEKFTEARVDVPVEVKNAPDNIRLIILPRTVVVKCNVAISQYANLSNRQFHAYIDYNDIVSSFDNTLRVNIIARMPFVSNIDFEPKYIEYIIEQI